MGEMAEVVLMSWALRHGRRSENPVQSALHQVCAHPQRAQAGTLCLGSMVTLFAQRTQVGRKNRLFQYSVVGPPGGASSPAGGQAGLCGPSSPGVGGVPGRGKSWRHLGPVSWTEGIDPSESSQQGRESGLWLECTVDQKGRLGPAYGGPGGEGVSCVLADGQPATGAWLSLCVEGNGVRAEIV